MSFSVTQLFRAMTEAVHFPYRICKQYKLLLLYCCERCEFGFVDR